MAQFGFTFDKARCVSCHSCAVACKSEQNTPEGVRYRQVVSRETGTYAANNVVRAHTSMACYHCETPACVAACPAGAMTKEATFGTVQVNSDKCIGCRRCAAACPYGAPQFNPATRKTEKCTGCWHRVVDASTTPPTLKDQGRPACVVACPARALGFDVKTTWGAGTEPDGFYDRTKTKPSADFD